MEDNQKFEHTVIKTQMSMEQQTNCQLQINNMEKYCKTKTTMHLGGKRDKEDN